MAKPATAKTELKESAPGAAQAKSPPTNRAPRLWAIAVIPCYNEELNVAALIDEIRRSQPSLDLLFIDDGSTDRSAEIARSKGARVLSHPFNMGYGVALQTGYEFALGRGYEMVIQLDGDGQHDPSFIEALRAPVDRGEVELTVGSRFLEGHGYVPPFVRRAGMVIFGGIASIITKRRVTDPTSGFQCLSRPAFRYFTGEHFPFDYPDADVLILLHRARFRACEVPVNMRDNPQGRSMHSGLRPIYYVFKMFLSIIMTLLREAPIGRLDDAHTATDHDG